MEQSKLTKNEMEEDDEALSLSDLPINGEQNQPGNEEPKSPQLTEEFDFNSRPGSVFIESQMCAADDVFFQGQILPYRHSVSSDTGIPSFRIESRCISRSESMDHFHSGGVINSRSSSIGSQYSSSSGGSSTKGTTVEKQRIRNYFHSHPSPSPQIRFAGTRYGSISNYSRQSNLWSFFRVGLVRTPGIELLDLRIRSFNSNSNKNFGSRNSTSSNCSSQNRDKIADEKNYSNIEKKEEKEKEKKKKKKGFFSKNGAFFGGCKCSVNVINPVPSSRAVIIKTDPENEEREEEMKKKTEHRHRKQTTSRHRTFEWLKELALAGAPEET